MPYAGSGRNLKKFICVTTKNNLCGLVNFSVISVIQIVSSVCLFSHLVISNMSLLASNHISAGSWQWKVRHMASVYSVNVSPP